MWVIDASVAIRWVLADETHPHAEAVLQHVVSKPEAFAIPELFCFEVFSVLCRLHPHPLEAFSEGILPVIENGVFRHPMTQDLAVAAGEFTRCGLTGYDACYAALAASLQGVWLTFDSRAHRKIASRNISHLLSGSLPKNGP